MSYAISTNRIVGQANRCHPYHLASIAKHALIAEAELTPKPGLVDRRGSGAHTDLSLDLMRRSAETIEPFFAAMAVASSNRPLCGLLREELGEAGRNAEHAMFLATGGTNTHKGAIWVLGLLVAAASQSGEVNPARIAELAGSIARLPDRARPELVSHGDVVRERYSVAGARGEAYADFPHVVRVGIPTLRTARAAGRSETASRLFSLLSIMAELDDTCVLYRSGLEGREVVKKGAKAVLAVGGPGSQEGDAALRRFDRTLLDERISPGGSADLLAASLFLDCLESGREEIEKDQSVGKEIYGEA
ncbi:MAG TPA: triphosphoribosyl-dephospho-CoA synthase [Acidobacteriaceae bacterium]|nr:triphosphoribosyl-dephospho-CoA synthase [Acidobacteriaceae bacterium]